MLPSVAFSRLLAVLVLLIPLSWAQLGPSPSCVRQSAPLAPRECASSTVDLSALRALNDVSYRSSNSSSTVWLHTCGPVQFCDCPIDSLLCVVDNTTQRARSLVDYLPGLTYFNVTTWPTGWSTTTTSYYNVSDGVACPNDATVNRTLWVYFQCAPQLTLAEQLVQVQLNEQSCQHVLWVESPYACISNTSGNTSMSSSTALPPPVTNYTSSSSSSTGSAGWTGCVNSEVDLRPLIQLGSVWAPYSAPGYDTLLFQPCGAVPAGLTYPNATLVLYNSSSGVGVVLVGYSATTAATAYQINTTVMAGYGLGLVTTYTYNDTLGNLVLVYFVCDRNALHRVVQVSASGSYANPSSPYFVQINTTYACMESGPSSSTALPPPVTNYTSSSSSSTGSAGWTGCVNSEVDLRPLIQLGSVWAPYSAPGYDTLLFQPCGAVPAGLTYPNATLVLYNSSSGVGVVLVGYSATTAATAYQINTTVMAGYGLGLVTTYTYNDTLGNLVLVYFVCDRNALHRVVQVSASGSYANPSSPYFVQINTTYACMESGPSSSTALPPPVTNYTSSSSSSTGSAGWTGCVNSEVDLRPLIQLGSVWAPYSAPGYDTLLFQPCGAVPAGLTYPNATLVLYNSSSGVGVVLVGYSATTAATAYQINTTVMAGYGLGLVTTYTYNDTLGNLVLVYFVCDRNALHRVVQVSASGSYANPSSPYFVQINTTYACMESGPSSSTALPPPVTNYTSSSSSSTGSAGWTGCVNSEVDLRPLIQLGSVWAPYSAPGYDTLLFQPCGAVPAGLTYPNATLVLYNSSSGVGVVLVGYSATTAATAYQINTTVMAGYGLGLVTTYTYNDTLGNLVLVYFVCDRNALHRVVQVSASGSYANPSSPYFVQINTTYACMESGPSSSTALPPPVTNYTSSSSSSTGSAGWTGCVNSEVDLRPLIQLGSVWAPYSAPGYDTLLFQPCGAVPAGLTYPNATLVLYNSSSGVGVVLVGYSATTAATAYQINTTVMAGYGLGLVTTYTYNDTLGNLVLVYFVCDRNALHRVVQVSASGSYANPSSPYFVQINTTYACMESGPSSSTALPPPVTNYTSSSSSSTGSAGWTGCVNSEVDLRPLIQLGSVWAPYSAPGYDTLLFQPCGAVPAGLTYPNATLVLYNSSSGVGVVLVGYSATTAATAYQINTTVMAGYGLGLVTTYTYNDTLGNLVLVYFVCDRNALHRVVQVSASGSYANPSSPYFVQINTTYACMESGPSSSTALPPPVTNYTSSSSSSTGSAGWTGCVNSEVDLRPLIQLGSVWAPYSAPGYDTLLFQPCGAVPAGLTYPNATLVLYNSSSGVGVVLVGYSATTAATAYQINTTVMAGYGLGLVTTYTYNDTLGNLVLVYFVCDRNALHRVVQVSASGSYANPSSPYFVQINTTYACMESGPSSSTALPPPVVVPSLPCTNNAINLLPLLAMNDLRWSLGPDQFELVFHPCGAVQSISCGANSLLCYHNTSSFSGKSLIDYDPSYPTPANLTTVNNGSTWTSVYTYVDPRKQTSLTLIFVCNWTQIGEVLSPNAIIDEWDGNYTFTISSQYACPIQPVLPSSSSTGSAGSSICSNSTFAVDVLPLRAMGDLSWQVGDQMLYFHPCAQVLNANCPTNSTFCLFNMTSWQSFSLVDYSPSLQSSSYPLTSYADDTSVYRYFDRTRCERPGGQGTFGRSLRVVFTCDPLVPRVTVVAVDASSQTCEYEVHVSSAYACSPLLPTPPLSTSSGSSGGGNGKMFYLDGHSLTTPELIGLVVVLVLVLVFLSLCCYLLGRRRKPEQQQVALLDSVDGNGPEGLVVVAPRASRRPRPSSRSCSTDSSSGTGTGGEQCACGAHHTPSHTPSPHPSGISHSSAGAYGLL